MISDFSSDRRCIFTVCVWFAFFVGFIIVFSITAEATSFFLSIWFESYNFFVAINPWLYTLGIRGLLFDHNILSTNFEWISAPHIRPSLNEIVSKDISFAIVTHTKIWAHNKCRTLETSFEHRIVNNISSEKRKTKKKFVLVTWTN